MGNINQEIVLITCVSAILLLVVFTLITFILWKKVNTMKHKYDAMIDHAGVANLEDVIAGLQQKLSANQTMNIEHAQSIQRMKSKISGLKGNVAMQRYNAFSESGSDQSFSIAFVDEQLDGLVFTVIHGREETYSYGKPLVKGESKYPLSPEERQVINLAQSESQNPA